jgi:hypothetical protein
MPRGQGCRPAVPRSSSANHRRHRYPRR